MLPTLTTPYDVQNKPLQEIKPSNSVNKKKVDFQYGNKFRSAVYAAVLFILLSQKVSYKILDLILKVFSHRIDVIDDDDNPQFIGTIIMAFVIGMIIFLF